MYTPEKTIGAYVSYGEGVKMYTLRVLTEGYDVIGDMKAFMRRDYYVKNLSINREQAIAKAKAYADSNNIKFLDSDSSKRELEEIRRRNKEEVESRRRVSEENALRESQRQYESVVEEVEKVGVDIVVFGKYKGSRINDVIESDPEYIKYLLDQNEHRLPIEWPRDVYEYCLNTIFKTVKENDIDLVPEAVSEFIGSVGDKITVQVTVKRKVHIDGYYSSSTLYVFEDVEGNIITTYYSGKKWKASPGDKGLIEGTVKKHELYNDVKQTVLNRVKFTHSGEHEEDYRDVNQEG